MKKSTVRAIISMVNAQLNVEMFDRVINDILGWDELKSYLSPPLVMKS
ncbi:hypothetical protein [Shewanella phage FishSpeaker]|nr:hypothetical protein [Shewanella phage FishSpeaker]